MLIPSTTIDEDAYVSIFSSSTWQDLGSLQLVPVTQNTLAFNRGTNQLLGILPQFPITLGGKAIYINVMEFQVHLDFNLLLRHDYVYDMVAFVSSLFCMMCFLHEGIIMTIDKLSFVGPNLPQNQPISLNCPYMQVVSSPS